MADLPSCPCGRSDQRARPISYALCCGRYVDHFDAAPAPDPESLMRSRYTAFVRERGDYLLATWHAATRPSEITFDPGVRWLGLEIRSRSMSDGEHAEVAFVARQRDATGRASRLEERSRFLREAGRWYYVDGELA
ncbi:MAG: YchJ family metal-binding protein [Variovorax sp.]